MGYAWIDEVQQYIDQHGVADLLAELQISGWTSYESCLCQVNLENVTEDAYVFATIAAQGMLANVGYQAILFINDGGDFHGLDLSEGIASIEDGFLGIDLSYIPFALAYLLNSECAFLLTSDSPSEITSLQVVRIEPAGAVLTFDFPTPSPSTPLTTPTGLYADNITSDSARTNWQAVENASNYKVQYKAAGDTVWTETFTE